eukprot:TRINITY_DN8750_c0_g1_i1.p1 TRINITY_DN8750_c0_g1~~TRINITY_DN8750_c0_g1_i1.p1  ORF type:complete len:880 (+),score=459.22 TRINITY_DN8750_c0_g1_i1:83-2722(+)
MAALPTDLTGLLKKAFICDTDTHLGRVLCDKLHKDHEISGTTTLDSEEPQEWVTSLVQRDQAHLLKKTLLGSDLIIYQLLGQDNVVDATAALKILMNSHYEVEKTFVLISSVMTWFETQQAEEKEAEELGKDEEEEEAEGEAEAEEKEQPTYTESDYNKRVPHVKYQDWKEVEKLCKKANSDTLHTYCIFSGLLYGRGEDKLHPIFKQAWHLRPEGLPQFGLGSNVVPMVHVDDLATAVVRLSEAESPLPTRYLFGVDGGNCTWNAVVKAINGTDGGMGTGRVNKVPPRDYVLYENVEHFIVNLKIAEGDGKIFELLGDDWKCQSGFVENIATVVSEYKEARAVTPLRLCVLGPPASGKTYYSRMLANKYKLPHITILDVIQDYENQSQELQEELERLQRERKEDKVRARLKRLREELKEKKKAEQEAREAGGGDDPDADAAADAQDGAEEDDDFGDDMDFIFDDELEQELKKDEAEGGADEDEDDPDEARAARKEELEKKLGEVKMVLALKEKDKKDDGDDIPDPRKKAKAPDRGKPKKEPQAVSDEDEKPKAAARYTAKALGFMVQWRLRQPNCRNQGYILDGYPRTVKEARFLYEDGLPGAVPEEPGEEDEEPPALEPGEQKRCDDSFFPDYIVQLKACDTFLTERVQKIQDQAHNAPEDFQRRLEAYKVSNPAPDRLDPPRDPDKGLAVWLECSLTNRMRGETEEPREVQLRQFEVDKCLLTPLPPPTTLAEEAEREKKVDDVFAAMVDFVGEPHNYGPSPQEIAEEEDRQRRVEQEKEEQRHLEELQRQQRERDERDAQLRLRQQEEERLASMKAEEREMLEIRKEPLKEYLMTKIIPVLTKGLIEVCEQRPEDPIDYLAEWLYHHNPVEDQDI